MSICLSGQACLSSYPERPLSFVTDEWPAGRDVLIDARYMYFNFLQMMGLSMIICIPFLRLGKWNLIPAVFFILLGIGLEKIKGPAWLMVFGILPPDFVPRDYFPIFPWVGVMLLGVCIGALLYPNGIRRYAFPEAGKISQALAFIGRYPLEIYLAHIPLIGAVILVSRDADAQMSMTELKVCETAANFMGKQMEN